MPEIDEIAFRKHLEWLVDLLPEESAPYIEERPRFVHAVLVLADEAHSGEAIKASCIKQLDPEVVEHRTKLTQITQVNAPDLYTIDDKSSAKNNTLIDSGISNENQISSEEESDKLEQLSVSSELICPTQQIAFVPISKYVRSNELPNDRSEASFTNSGHNYTNSHCPQGLLADNGSDQQREDEFLTNKINEQQIPAHVKQDSDANRVDNHLDDFQRVNTESYSYKIPQMQGTVYERPEIISRTYRSHVEETTFPSIDRYRTVRSETVRVEPRSPRSMFSSTLPNGKTTRTTTETYTVTSVPHAPNKNDAISQAVQILQSSCDMLDATVDRIQRQKLLSGQNSTFNFPSESRKSKTSVA